MLLQKICGEPVCNISLDTLNWNKASLDYVSEAAKPVCNLSPENNIWNQLNLAYSNN